MIQTAPTKINLLDFNRHDMQQYFSQLGEKPYRADQMLKWVHQHGIVRFETITNFNKVLQQRLAEIAEVRVPKIAVEKISDDGTCKWLLQLDDGNCIEMVYIPEKNRGTLCVSSQVGCALNCSFCSTAKQGFSRNLSVAEIIGQVWLATRRLSKDGMNKDHVITNVVMMGMGEPLLNFDAVVKAMDIMLDDLAYGLSKYRVTLSTSGVVPAMLQLKTASPVSLAVSLHAPNDALRNNLVPLNKKYPLKVLLDVCKDYFKGQSKRVVTFEYVMLAGINDGRQHAHELAQLLRNVPCKLNLIPFNPFQYTEYQCSALDVIYRFQKILQEAGYNVTVRKTRGNDIYAACGQLNGAVKDRTQRNAKWMRDKGIRIFEETTA